MSQILQNIELELDDDIKEYLQRKVGAFSSFRILRQSVDARRSNAAPKLIYSVEVFAPNESETVSVTPVQKHEWPKDTPRPIVVGTGPAGLFAALRFVEAGLRPLIFERGSPGEIRIGLINKFWRYGTLDVDNNVCIGEGGAGLYSDGKLITRIKSPHIPYVMERLVKFGAPAEITYLANPHVGSDRIRRVIPKLREYLLQEGAEIFFNSPVTEFVVNENSIEGVQIKDGRTFKSPATVLATGHSAEDVLNLLSNHGVKIEGKSYALGLRIEHPQEMINKAQFRVGWNHPKLGAANYKLTDHDKNSGVGVYSFCMCPGGYVLSSGTEVDGLVSNGMSNYRRNSTFANAAIVVTIDHEKLFGPDIFGGLKLRRIIEQKAYQAVQNVRPGSHALPAQRVSDFLKNRLGDLPATSCPSGIVPVRFDEILPTDVVSHLKKSLLEFAKKIPDFAGDTAVLHGVETRTSCPIRVTRNETSLMSLSHPGLYPTGEGAGYAGGITSAACDGVKVADQIVRTFLPLR